MPQNIFKIYDGRTSFWQWDTRQKLIVLNDDVTEVHFSNRNMTHSIKRVINTESNGTRFCNVPDDLLKMPCNLVASAYADGAIIKAVKFAVVKRPMPSDYISDQSEQFEQIDSMIEALNDKKADDLYYDIDNKYIQLVANGEPVGNRVELQNSGIADCKVDENGDLIVTLTDGRIINAGYVGAHDGVTFIPSVSEDNILSWTNDGGLENPEPVDLNPFDEWTTLPEEGVTTEYEWEYL